MPRAIRAKPRPKKPAPVKLPAPDSFRSSLLLERGTVFRPAPFQLEDFKSIDAAMMQMMTGKATGSPSRIWIERPRGSSKTTDIALACMWCLAFAPHQLNAAACASDLDQATLLRAAMQRLLNWNPWLKDTIDVTRWQVTNKETGSTLNILSGDAGSNYGHLIDLLVCDEISVWSEGRGENLWVAMLSAVAKKSNAVAVVISNAGWRDTWVWKVREKIRQDSSWAFLTHDQPAPWIKQSALDEQRRLLPPSAYARLWMNEWCAGGDALDEADLEAALTLEAAQAEPKEGFTYYLGADAAVSGDRAAIALIGQRAGRVEVAVIESWRPARFMGFGKKRIDLQAFESRLLELAQRFSVRHLAADQYQMELTLQRLAAQGLSVSPVSFTSTPAQEMANAVLSHFSNRSIALYPCDELLADLRKLRIIENRQGYRLDAPRTKEGHADTAIALSLALWAATKFPQATYTPGSIRYGSPSVVKSAPPGVFLDRPADDERERHRQREDDLLGVRPLHGTTSTLHYWR